MSVQFNGSNQYITTPSNSAFAESDISITAWVNLSESGLARSDMVAVSSTDDISWNAQMAIGFQNGRMVVTVNNFFLLLVIPIFSDINITAANPIPADTWTFVAATITSKAVRAYQDTVEIGTGNTTNIITVGDTVTIGAVQTGRNAYGRYFDGRIEDVRFYNRGLSQAEVQTIYHAKGKDMIQNGLIVRYPLQDDTDGTVTSGTLTQLTTRQIGQTVSGSPTYSSGIIGVSRRY